MRIIFQIARNELRQLFYSPLAWTVLVALYMVGVLGYFSAEKQFMEYYLRGGTELMLLEFLTRELFTAMLKSDYAKGIVSVFSCLTLFLPLITMGAFAREFRNGTDKLLFSAPVSITQLVFGKFAGLMVFNLMVLIVFAIIFSLIGINVDRADWMLLLGGLVSIYLITMLFVAMGMFFSSLTTYPLVAALLTLCFGILMAYASGLVELIGNHSGSASVGFMIKFGYIADYLRIGHLGNALMNGVVHSREIVHFFNATAVFIILTLIRLKSRRERVAKGKKLFWYTALFTSFGTIAYLSTDPHFILLKDITREKRSSLHPNTVQFLKGMDQGPLEVVYYINLLDNFGVFHPSRQYSIDRYWERYRVVKPDIRIRYVYYYDKRGGNPKQMKKFEGKDEREIAETYASSPFHGAIPINFFRPSADIAGELDLEFEQFRNVAYVSYQGKSTMLRCFSSPPNMPGTPYFPEETEILPVLHRLTGTQPRVFFSTGHAEVDPNGVGTRGVNLLLNNPLMKPALINQGVDSDTITVEYRALPDTARLLAICDPWLPFPAAFLTRFNEFVEEGRNLLLMLEPDKRVHMAPLLDRLGLRVRPGVLGTVNPYYTGERVRAYTAYPIREFSKSLDQHHIRMVGYLKDSLYTEVKGAVALEQVEDKGFKVEPILVLDTVEAFNRPAAHSLYDVQKKLRMESGDEIAPFTLGFKLTRQVNGNEQRIVVLGDADVRSTFFDELSPDLFGWLTDSGFPVDLVKPEPLDKTFAFEHGTTRRRKAIWIYGVTGLMILIASVVLIRRNRN